MLAISLIGRVNLNNRFGIKVSQLYNAVPWQVTYKTDDIYCKTAFFILWFKPIHSGFEKWLIAGDSLGNKNFILALGERAYSTLPYSEKITVVSRGES